MAENVTLNPVVTFTNDTTAVNTVNSNYTTITNAFADVLSLSGVSPNQMKSQLDMNSNQIINLPPPGTTNSPARLVDVVSNPTITVPPTGTSGATVPFLNGNNTWSGSNTFNGPVSMPTAWPALTGGTIGQVLVKNNSVNGNASWYDNCLNIEIFGGVGNGTTDNTAALNAALAALPSGGGCIYFPAGKWRFNSAISFSFPGGSVPFSVTIKGDGEDNSILFWPSTNGLSFSMSSPRHTFHIRDLSFTTGSNGGFTGFSATNSVQLLNFAQNDIQNVLFRGDDGGVSLNYWTNGIALTAVSNVNFINCLFYGSINSLGQGVLLVGNPSGGNKFGIVFNFTSCGFFNNGVGIQIGTYIQGVTVTQCNFTNGVTGIFVPSGSLNVTEIAVMNSQFNTTANQIDLEAPVASLMVIGNLIYVPTTTFQTGILLNSSGLQSYIVGNVFTGFPVSNTNSVGVDVLGAMITSICSNNVFANLFQGINLVGTSTWNVQGNTFTNVSSAIVNTGTNYITGNQGYNPVGTNAAVTMGTSPFTVTSGASPETHYVNQGATNTATITKSGRQIATLAGASTFYPIQLGPNESYVTTWTTTAPTYVRDIH